MSAWWKRLSPGARVGALAMVVTMFSCGTALGALWAVEEAQEAQEVPSEDAGIAAGVRQEKRRSFDEVYAEGEARREKHRQEQKRRDAERVAKVRAYQAALDAERPPKPPRKLRRWRWQSPAEIRAKVWHVPENEAQEATETALLRICTSEMANSVRDCIGIWQVIGNIRQRSCDRNYTDLITECDDNGETHLSAMRRASRYVVGAVPPKHRRHKWIARMELDCEKPAKFPRDQRFWDRHHRDDCERIAKLARELVGGRRRAITRAPIIAWGGRCEVPGGACDDPLACARGLARVPDTDTANAFWCKIGSKRCRQDVDPICVQLGYGRPAAETAGRKQQGDQKATVPPV